MNRLERLFQFYSVDLARYAPSLAGKFGCPLCHQTIPRVDDLREVVAEEHIVPQALGGRLTTLTCRRCNSHHGSSLDSHLIQRVRIEAKKKPLLGRMSVGDGEQGIQFHPPKSDTDPFQLIVIKKQSDARGIEASKSALEAGERSIHIKLSFGYNETRSMVALVRAAHLLMFRHFGYRYVLDPCSKPIHLQIQNPTKPSPVLDSIQWRFTHPIPVATALGVVRSPKKFQSFMAIFELDTDTQHRAALLLPGPGDDGARLYCELQTEREPWPFQVTTFPPPIDRVWPFVEVWQHYTGSPETRKIAPTRVKKSTAQRRKK